MQNTPLEKLDKKHFAKGSRVFQQNGTAAALQQDENSKEIALMEAKMQKLCDLLDEVRPVFHPHLILPSVCAHCA